MQLVKQFKKGAAKVAVGVSGLAVAGMAAAQTSSGIDVTAATAAVSANGTSMTTVGTAIIGLAAISLGIRWIKATFFG